MTTKKDFIAAAKQIAAMQDKTEAETMAKGFAEMFSRQNPRFDFNRFYSACGVTINK